MSSIDTPRSWMRRLLVPLRVAEPRDLSGQHILVTGASPGSLGLATAQALANWGARVVITSRNLATAEKALALCRVSGAGQLSAAQLDLCDAQSVNSFAEQFSAGHPDGLDVLINNAGIHLDLLSRWKTPHLTADGYEIHWRTNYLGSFHLTQLLLPQLLQRARQRGQARVVNVVSQLHARGRNEHLLTPAKHYNSWVAYGTSKLAMMHMSTELHRRYADQGLRSYSLHPGAVYSQIAGKGLAEAPRLSRVRQRLSALEQAFMFTPQEGAQTSLYCATSPDAPSAGYFRRAHQVKPANEVNDHAVAQALWLQSLDWLAEIGQQAQTA